MRRQVWIAGIAAASQTLLGSGAAYAEIGVVAYYKSGCDHYIVSASQGYAVLEWYGGMILWREISLRGLSHTACRRW
jgi:hypothetical protein